MSYARIDDLKPHLRAVLDLGRDGPAAFGWYSAAHCYAERHKTDGLVPRAALGLLMPGAGIPTARMIALLERSELWRPLPDNSGWELTDYLVHNDPIAVRSEKGRRAAMARWADARRNAPSNASGNASSTPLAFSPGMPPPVLPPPRPTPAPFPTRSSDTPGLEPTRPDPGLSRAQLGSDNGLSPDEAKQRIASVIARLAGGSEAP